MINHNDCLKIKTNTDYNYNYDLFKKNYKDDFYINIIKNKKESNIFFSQNVIDISLLNQYNDYIAPLSDDCNSEFSPLILESNSKNMLSIEEREKDGNIYNTKKRDTNNRPITKFKIKKTNKKQIFLVKKIVKLGRIRKNSQKKGKHDKYQRDNVIRRFKVFLMKNIYNYINHSFIINNNRENNNIVNVLQRISSFNSKSISKKDNIKWFNSKIKDVFSENLKKYTCYDLDYNKKLINKVIQEGKEKNTIYILNKTIKEMWFAYINDDKNNDFIGFETIKHDIKKLRKIGETEAYIDLYIQIANDFENIFNEITPRISRKK